MDALPTLFHGHPDGATTLVRFTADGVDAAAGRLRVTDLQSGRLVGTAGMIRRDGRLTGALWIPLVAARRVRSELETPATRGVHRTVHDLEPTRRWHVYWLTLAAPDAVAALFEDVPPLLRGVQAARLAAAGIRVNPWRPIGPRADHLDLLTMTLPGARVTRATGVPLSALALYRDAPQAHLDRALRGAGVEAVAARDAVVDPRALDLEGGRARAESRIEAWLLTAGTDTAGADGIVTAIGTDPGFALRARETVEEWNRTYAFPRFVVGDGDETIAALRANAPPAPAARTEPGPAADPAVDPPDPFLPLGRVVAPDDPTPGGIARRFAFPVGGTLVFNPAPFGRSGVVDVPDDGPRVVTDVPALGYAFVPDGRTAEPPEPVEGRTTIATAQFRVRLDPRGGGIASLQHAPSGRELVASGADLDGRPDAALSSVRAEILPDVGERIVARRVTGGAVIVTTVTAYDALPWIEVENTLEGPNPAPPREWRFGFAGVPAGVRWEVPGGIERAAPPVEVTPVRWLALEHDGYAVLVGVEGSPGSVDGDGGVRLRMGHVGRVRIGLHEGFLLPDDPWRFGFGLLPLHAHRAGGGDRTLPTFGRMLDVADPTVAVVGVRPADDGVGIMVYLQDLGGPTRTVAIRPGLLTFDGAILTDLAQRDRGPASDADGGGILVPVEASGYAAVRLLGLRLAGGEASPASGR